MNGMSLRLGLGSCALILLVGCATTSEITEETGAIVAQQWQRLDAAPTCCDEFADIELIELPDEGLRFHIKEGQARAFPSGKSYFQRVDLSRLDGASMLVVKSYQNVPRRNGLPYMVRPSYTVLDRNHQIVASRIDVPLCQAQGWGQDETGYFGLIRIDPERASSVVIHTADESRGTSVNYQNQSATAGGGVSMSFFVNYEFPASPVGEMELVPLDESMRKHLTNKCAWLFE